MPFAKHVSSILHAFYIYPTFKFVYNIYHLKE